ncbi:hypothetical protein ACFU8W_33010 [Streptomyces sp. NPDC057565]
MRRLRHAGLTPTLGLAPVLITATSVAWHRLSASNAAWTGPQS